MGRMNTHRRPQTGVPNTYTVRIIRRVVCESTSGAPLNARKILPSGLVLKSSSSAEPGIVTIPSRGSNEQVHRKLQRQRRPEPRSTRPANGDNLHRVRLPPHRLLRALRPHRFAPRRARPLYVSRTSRLTCIPVLLDAPRGPPGRVYRHISLRRRPPAACVRARQAEERRLYKQHAARLSHHFPPFLYVMNLYIIPICYVINL